MFYAQLEELCVKNGTKPTIVTRELGYSTGSMSQWKKGSSPSGDTLLKFADYFGVSTDYLLTGEENKIEAKKEPPPMTGLTHDIELILLEKGLLKEDTPMPQDEERALLDYLRLSVEAFKKAREQGS